MSFSTSYTHVADNFGPSSTTDAKADAEARETWTVAFMATLKALMSKVWRFVKKTARLLAGAGLFALMGTFNPVNMATFLGVSALYTLYAFFAFTNVTLVGALVVFSFTFAMCMAFSLVFDFLHGLIIGLNPVLSPVVNKIKAKVAAGWTWLKGKVSSIFSKKDEIPTETVESVRKRYNDPNLKAEDIETVEPVSVKSV